MTEKFDKPLNTWIEEDVEIKVMTPQFDIKTGSTKLKEETKKVKQKTFYSNNPTNLVICNKHHYVLQDKKKYIFKCTKCGWHKVAYPVTYNYNPETGELIHRETGQIV